MVRDVIEFPRPIPPTVLAPPVEVIVADVAVDKLTSIAAGAAVCMTPPSIRMLMASLEVS